MQLCVTIVLFSLLWSVHAQGEWHSLGTNEYFIYHGKKIKDSQAAVSACTSMNATLARIKTKQVQDFLVEKINQTTDTPYSSYYIGLNRTGPAETDFQWNDGSNMNYTNWRGNEPNNNRNQQECVQIGTLHGNLYTDLTYQWNDYKCNNPGRYICQRLFKPINSSIETTTDVTYNSTTHDVTTQTMTNASVTSPSPTYYYIIGIVVVIVMLIIGLTMMNCYKTKRTQNFRQDKKQDNSIELQNDRQLVDNEIYNMDMQA
ncbi:perlucin-like [Ciona intestinalis]